jgi:hypothetical protein
MNPESLEADLDLLQAARDVGVIAFHDNRWNDAKQLFETALKMGRRLIQADPQNRTYEGEYSGMLYRVTWLAQLDRRNADAKASGREYLEHARKSFAANPNSTENRGRLARALYFSSKNELIEGHKEQALAMQRECKTILEALEREGKLSWSDIEVLAELRSGNGQLW